MSLSIKNVACVHVTNNNRLFKINRKKITAIAAEICRRLGVGHYDVCLQFVSKRNMRSLNKKYRDKDKSTDVLSFPQYNWKRPLKVQSSPSAARPVLNPLPLGDVVISPEDASMNAKDDSQTLDRELCFLLVHGILHLVGHDHMKPVEKKRMFAEQTKLMRLFSGSKTKDPMWLGCIQRARSTAKKNASKTSTGKTATRKKSLKSRGLKKAKTSAGRK